MNVLAAAIVTAALVAADVASDIAVTDPGARNGWNWSSTIALVLFAVLVAYETRHKNKASDQ